MDCFCCLECGKKFKTAAAARRAADRGCPKCGATDVDLDTSSNRTTTKTVREATKRLIETGRLTY